MIDMHTQKTHNNSLHLLDKTQPREERNPAGVCQLKSGPSTQLYKIISLIERACWLVRHFKLISAQTLSAHDKDIANSSQLTSLEFMTT